MLNAVKDFIARATGDGAQEGPDEAAIQAAMAGLLARQAAMDGREDAREVTRLSRILQRHFDLDRDAANDLCDDALRAVERGDDLDGAITTLREAWDRPAQIAMVEGLIEIAFADGEMDDWEKALVNKVRSAFRIDAATTNDAMARVKARLGLE